MTRLPRFGFRQHLKQNRSVGLAGLAQNLRHVRGTVIGKNVEHVLDLRVRGGFQMREDEFFFAVLRRVVLAPLTEVSSSRSGVCLIDGIRLFRLDVRLRILARCRPVLRIVRLPGFVHRLGIDDRRLGAGVGVPKLLFHGKSAIVNSLRQGRTVRVNRLQRLIRANNE